MAFHRHRSKHLISLLVPFRADPSSPERQEIWKWLERFWQNELPAAEIVMGRSKGKVFSKSRAVNDAARRAHGDIFVILDADCYITGAAIEHCAHAIREAQERGNKLYFVPYRKIFRLTEDATHRVLASDPADPLRFPSPPDESDVESNLGSAFGHRFGAMVQIWPREAFEEVGCWDPRMAGWGAEDVSALRACDTLYVHHKTFKHDVLHLWHPRIGITHVSRMWPGQTSPRANEQLAQRYNKATGDRAKMRALVDEGCRRKCVLCRWWRWCWSWLIDWQPRS